MGVNARYKGAMSAGAGAILGGMFGVSALPVGPVGITVAVVAGAIIGYLIMHVLPNW